MSSRSWRRVLAVLLCVSALLLTAPRIEAEGAAVPGLERLQRFPAGHPLADAWVRVIHQDRWGFLWLGTINGVYRYDGYGVRNFRNQPGDPKSLPHNFVNDIFEDRLGHLWIATAGGVARLDARPEEGDAAEFVTAAGVSSFTVFRADPADPKSLSNDYVTQIAEDRDGDLWLATAGGAHRFDRQSQELTRVSRTDTTSDRRVLSVLRSRSGEIWLGGGDSALLRFDEEQQALESHVLQEMTTPRQGIWRLAEDVDGFLWCGTENGKFLRFDPRTRETRPFPLAAESVGYVTAVFPRPDGRLWVGTDKQGLFVLDPEGGDLQHFQPMTNAPGALSSGQVSDILEDRSGNLWLGTGAGLDKYDPARDRFVLYRHRSDEPASLAHDRVLALQGDRAGDLWVGTNFGLERMQKGRIVERYQHQADDPTSLSSSAIGHLFTDSAGDLWVATDQGLDLFLPEQRAFRHAPSVADDPEGLIETIHCLAEVEPGAVWAGGVGGLNRLDKESWTVRRFSDVRTLIDMLGDPRGLWLASYGYGLGRFDRATEEVVEYRHDSANPRSVSSDFLIALHRDQQGTLWIGTLGGGLNRFDPESREFTAYRESDGLASDNVVTILEDEKGYLWLGTHRGLTRFDPATEVAVSYTAEDGVQGSIFVNGAAWASPTGELYFGGNEGITRLSPQEIVDSRAAPQVAVSDFLLLHHSTPFAARSVRGAQPQSPHLTLGHRDDVFAFQFAALDFVDPASTRYRYRLEGFDSEWVETDARYRLAQYTNLDPGDYVFRVKAATRRSDWSEPGAAVRITVRPPPWLSWWAYLIYLAGLVVLVGGYVHSHRDELRRKEEEAERERQAARRERVANQRLREVDKLKDEFLAKTSHELRTPLYGITGLAESLIDGAAGQVSTAVKANLSMIAASGERLSHLVNDILDFSKLRHRSLELASKPVDLHSLVDGVLKLSRPLVGSKSLRLNNDVAPDFPPVQADENRLQQVLYNLIGNAIKFTEEGVVTVSAVGDGEKVVVGVADTGPGIAPEVQERMFEAFEQGDGSMAREFGGTGLGLAVTRQLVELHGGSIWVESQLGEGSTFFFSLPRAEDAASGDVLTVTVAGSSGLEAAPGVAFERTAPTSGAARILAVDDEPINLQVIDNYLASKDVQLVTASSGEEALRLIGEQRFDLVLLDVMMPKMSGFEVCRKLREEYPLETLPILFLTAKDQAEDVAAGLALGANDFLTKPIARDELIARLQPHLKLLGVHRHLEELVTEKMSRIKVLEGILPICAGCKKIRDEDGEWNQIESFIDQRSEAEFSHGICPSCAEAYRRQAAESS